MTCVVCGGLLPNGGFGSRGHKLKYCSKICMGVKFSGKLVTKHCAVCNAPFEVRDKNTLKVYCTDECGEKVRRPNKPVLTKDCLSCKKPFITSMSKRKFCSDECRYQHGLDSYVSPTPKTHYEYECDWCKETIIRTTHLGGSKRYHPECASKAKIARYRLKTLKRQGITDAKLRMCHEDLLARDGNICYLCEEPIDYERYRRSYPNGAWIDHVESLHDNGAQADRIENLRLTHGKCNLAKGKSTLEEYRAKSR